MVEVGPAVAHGVEDAVEEAVGRVHEEAEPLEAVPFPPSSTGSRLSTPGTSRSRGARGWGARAQRSSTCAPGRDLLSAAGVSRVRIRPWSTMASRPHSRSASSM